MSITSVTYTGNASTRSFSVPFPYLLPAHVKVYINDVGVSNYTWSNTGTILFNTAPIVDAEIVIRRETQTVPMVDFSSKNRWRSEELDLALKQSIYLAEESIGKADGWHTGTLPPASGVGEVGDFFLNTATGDVYEKNDAGVWVLKLNMMGPQGPAGAAGATGPVGPQGPAGPVGATIRILGVLNSTSELPATAGEGDAYLINRDLWVWVDYQFVDAGQIQAPPGATGATGPQGPKGDKGNPGNLWFSGAGAPNSALGSSGDWYIDQTNQDIYEKSVTSVWTVKFNIKGITGPKGDTGAAGPAGAAGKDGMRWYSGNGAPGGALGVAGDFYIDKVTFDTYQKVSTTWTFMGNIKGQNGLQGDKGEPGPIGPMGPAGPSGDGTGDMAMSRYDTNNDGKVDMAEVADFVVWSGVTHKPTVFPPDVHTHIMSDITGFHEAVEAKADKTYVDAENAAQDAVIAGKQDAGNYAAAVHGHSIADVSSLQATLDAKLNRTGDTMSGQLEIGNADPYLRLHRHGIVYWDLKALSDGACGIYNSNSAWGWYSVNGTLHVPGDVVAYWSDRRLKEEVKPLDGYEARIMGLRPVSFQWNEKGRSLTNKKEGEREIGFIAQDVQSISGQYVAENKTAEAPEGEDPYLTVKKDEMIADLVAMVQSLNKRIAKLEEMI